MGMGMVKNNYAGRCHVCGSEVAALTGLLDGKDVYGRSRVRHMGCLTTEDETAPAHQPTRDPFGKRVPTAPENIPALKDYLAEGERVAGDLEHAMTEMLGEVAAFVGAELDTRMTAGVPAMVAAELEKHKRLDIVIGDAPAVTVERHHAALPTVLQAVVAGASPFLVGPAGSGKTTLAEQIATTLGRTFYMAARVTSEFKLVGFRSATGETVRTQFREAYEHGGVFLFDEIDASDPDALTAFNAALANGHGDFPDGLVPRHKDFVAIAAGNTFGRGADRQYVGRNQLDAATLDRFAIYNIDYDEELELAIGGNPEWTKWVQSVRRAIEKEKVRHIVSPRASIMGAKLLAAGQSRRDVEEAVVWKGMAAPERTRIMLAREA